MAVADDYVYKISSRYLQKWLSFNIKHVKKHFSRHFETSPWFSGFFNDFDSSKSVPGSFFAFFAKIWPKDMYRCSKFRVFCFTFFTWWPEMTFNWIMVIKDRKWHLKMSVTLSMPILWRCLCLTSKFCSPMLPSPKKLSNIPTLTRPVTMGGELSKREGVLFRLFQSEARTFSCFFHQFTQIYALITITLLDIGFKWCLWSFYFVFRGCFWQWEGAPARSGGARAPLKPLIVHPCLWRHQWPLGQISHHVWKVHAQGYRISLNFGNRSNSFGDHGGDTPPPPLQYRVRTTN